ncbi:MAG: DUF1365 family protein [Hyphomonadaceae bacterium]|nr:DUF1365 family protein [Hyphomonadaceae bacterium]
MTTALYTGLVAHERFRPARHRLAYRVFMGLFDLDELPTLRLRTFRHNRPALVSFFDADHGDGSGRPLRPQIEQKLRDANIPFDGGPIRVLAMPRVLNYVFNPLSVFFCYARDGRLLATVHQVNNTFGERHFYTLPAQILDNRVEQSCAKTFRVSPFLALDMRYRFSLQPPEEHASVAILASDAAGPMLTASFKGARRPFTDRDILRAWLTHPLLTLKVVAGIHWEALFIWLKLKRAAAKPNAPLLTPNQRSAATTAPGSAPLPFKGRGQGAG